MPESIKELQAILDNAPEGATHIDNDGYFWVMGEESRPLCFTSYCFDVTEVTFESFRALSDIKRIVELMKELQK